MARILVALSGGVDSAVAAWLLREAGHELLAVTLELMPRDATVAAEVQAERSTAARRIAARLGLAHEWLDARADFEREVVAPFVGAYAAGETPNPCARCNARIKLGRLIALARDRGYSRVATGHYARLTRSAQRAARLRIARDGEKDQSYMLWALTPEACARLEFPLGERTKAEVRQLAQTAGIAADVAAESQDLCFIGEEGYGAFLARRLDCAAAARQPGAILHVDGRRLGEHRGLIHFTPGQRRGLGVSSPSGEPLYVVALEPATRVLRVGEAHHLARRTVCAGAARIHDPAACRVEARLAGRLRHRQPLAAGRVTAMRPQGFTFRFDAPQQGVAAGQSLVLYAGEHVVAGGRIMPVDRS